MKRFLFLTILFFLSFFFTKNVFAATEFISVVDTGGAGDYSSLSLWETAIDSDLTSASNKVFGGTKTGTIADGASVTGSISLATGTVYHATATQIYLIVLTGTFQSAEQIQVDGSNYFTTTDAGDSAIAIAKCRATTGAADTTAVTIDGWTTSAANYIKVWTDPSENYRHNGKWDEGKYRLDVVASGYTYPINMAEEYGWIDGIQINISGATAFEARGIIVNPPSNGEVKVSNNITKAAMSAGGVQNGIALFRSSKVWNNIAYNFEDAGINASSYNGSTSYVYNNTVYGCGAGVYNFNSDHTVTAKNNLAYNNTDNYSGAFNASSTNNLSGPGTDADIPATNARNGYIVHFADEANDDFHLDSSDTGARNQGIILYDAGDDANLNFTTDVDNNARLDSAGTWDIGADEVITKVYRSVGPSASSALSVGSTYGNVEVKAAYLSGSTTNITDYIASFWSDLPTNVGVGDALQYDDDDNGTIDASDSIVFITKRIDASHFSVRTASGAAPASTLAPDSDWSIFRAYTSLFNAEAGTENTGIDADLVNFDTWSGGKNIQTSQEQWNMVCYAGQGGVADTVATTIGGWTTSADSFIKIYTPTRSDEVGVSQRHNGIWDEGKYIIRSGSADLVYIGTNNSYLRIDGIQFDDTESSYLNHAFQGGGAPGEIHISNCIMKNTGSGAANGMSIESTGGIFKIWNNIIYGFGNGISFNNTATGYIYNNTIVAITNYSGIRNQNGNSILYAKNNIVQGSPSSAYFGTFQVGSDYNISDDTSTTGGAHDKPSITTVAFFDSANNDFHLAPSDTEAKNAGADLSNDPYIPFNTDIDSVCLRKDNQSRVSNGGDDLCYTRPRGTSWDIGADELITKIYRSVAPDADGSMSAIDDDNSLADTLTIATSGIATFEVAVTDIAGVGDALVWDDDGDNDLDVSDTILFIHGRTDSTHYTVRDADGSLPDVGTTDNDKWAIYRAYTSLSNAESGAGNTAIPITFIGGNRDIATNSEQWNIACYANGTTADTAAVTINGWTTAPQNYIKIFTPTLTSEVGTSQRHLGKWDDGKYRVETSNSSGIVINANNVSIEGLQIKLSITTSGSSMFGVYVNTVTSGAVINISSNIIKADISDSSDDYYYGIFINNSNCVANIYNNIIYNFTGANSLTSKRGITVAIGTAYIYNNTFSGCYWGIRGSGGTSIIKNNISYNNTTDYTGTFNSASTNNLSKDATAPAYGTYYRNITDLAFVDATNYDFHLATTDTRARNLGADLSLDYNLPITNDIDGHSRTFALNSSSFAIPDIGADESAIPIYRSIAPSKTDALASGAGNNLTISGTTATFASTVEGTNAVGVGDAIQYDSNDDGAIDAIAFISARASGLSFTVQDRAGTSPAPTTAADQDWSIFRAYTTLDNAEGGVENTANMSPNVYDFDRDVGAGDGKDIYTANQQWNIAAYANGTTADTAAVIVDGWTTAPQNYIKIYTPTATSEVGTSQRHGGKWDEGKYRLEISSYPGVLYISENNIRIDGLQIDNDGAVYAPLLVSEGATVNEIQISNNILVVSGASNAHGYDFYATGSGSVKFWNNIINGTSSTGNGISLGYYNTTTTHYIYNNTVVNFSVGIRRYYGTVYLKNNIAYNNTTDYTGTFNSASTNNLSEDGTAPPYNTYYTGKTLTFVNTTVGSEDFHLALSDTDAMDKGTDLSADSYLPFSTDIDEETRGHDLSNWDIGADEWRSYNKSNVSGLGTATINMSLTDKMTNGLVGMWSFDGPDIDWATNTAYDRSGQGNNGTISGATSIIGKKGQGLNFNGTSDYVDLGSNVPESLTMSAWVNIEDCNTYQKIISQVMTNTYRKGIYVGFGEYGSVLQFAENHDERDCACSTGWHHFVMTNDGVNYQSIKFYVDSVEILSEINILSFANTTRTAIGIDSDLNGENFNGVIDEVRIYNRALSADEVGDLYRLGEVEYAR